MNKFIFLAFCFLSYLPGITQSSFFTKKTNCGFEFSLSKKFVKSKSYNYYSNSMCFDTVLTNKKGTLINIVAIDKGKGAQLDSIDYAVMELERFGKDLQQDKNYYITNKNYISINSIKFGVLEYQDKRDKPKQGYRNHKYIVFYVKKTIVVYISIYMKDTSYNNIDADLINTIKKI